MRRSRTLCTSSAVCRVERLEPRVLLSASLVDTEFNVTSVTAGDQQSNGQGGAVSMDGNGGFVVVWTGTDASGTGVFAQRYNLAGVPKGSQIQVNSMTTGNQGNASVHMDSNGDFVITWTSDGQDGSTYGVYARRFNPAGVAQGSEFLVSTTMLGDQANPSVAVDRDGDFVISWSSSGDDGWGDEVFAQRYDSNGVSQGGEIRVNTARTGDQANATVDMNEDGGFVVTWSSDGQDGSLGGIYAQRYDSTGAALGGEFQVNTTSAGHQDRPVVGLDQNGDFVITWTSNGQDGSGDGVFAQRFDSNGAAQGTEFLVNNETAGNQNNSTVSLNHAGDFVISWTSDLQDGSGLGVFARAYTAGGLPQGTEFQVNTYTTSDQFASTVALYKSLSDFVVVWTSSGQDGSGLGVYAQQGHINVDLPNQSPVLSVSGGITYTQGDAALPMNTGLTVTDVDNTTLARATVTITNFVAGQDALAFINDGLTMGDVAVASNAGGVLSLTSTSGAATVAQWQAALRAVSYSNTGDHPDTTQRMVAFVVNDGTDDSDTGISTIDITAVNDAPVLAGIEPGFHPYPPAAPAVVVTSTLTLSDLDNATMSGATIQITDYYQDGSDVLAFIDTPNIAGVWNATTGTMTLSGSDTVANYQAALRSVTYQSTSQDPTARVVSFQVNDGTSLSNIATRAIGGELQLVGAVLNIYGTMDADGITVAEGASLTIHRNGRDYVYSPAAVTAINIYCNDGNDTVQVKSLAAGTGLQAFGGNGNDTLRVGGVVASDVSLEGGNGNDLLVGGSGNDTLTGGVGNDWLNGGDGNDSLAGNEGNDVYAFGDAFANQVDTVTELAGEGTDVLNFESTSTAATVNLTSDSALATMWYRLVQTGGVGQAANVENAYGGAANDIITGNMARNLLYGNGGNDTIVGGNGNDDLRGGAGNDELSGGIGGDLLAGGSGNDLLQGDDGFDELVGGTGNDIYFFQDTTENQIETVIELADEGIDTLNFASLTTAVTANLTNDPLLVTIAHRIIRTNVVGQALNFENVTGGAGNDQVTGNGAGNILRGNGGNDHIIGGGGNDALLGGDGNDTLKGISGRNVLVGGTGRDLLLGGSDEDILLSGALKNDSDDIVQSVLIEWAQATPYGTRVNNLLPYVNSTYVGEDAGRDSLTGAEGRNWFLANSVQDLVTDMAVDEVFTHIDGLL